MEKIIHKLINDFTKGVDTYTYNGSTWLIFTESKQWVVELTDGKTLWYNYNFFKGIFSYTSMDVVDNQHYITKWVEDNVINKVKDTILEKNITEGEVEEIIENGVKEHSLTYVGKQIGCEDTIKNGVKHTEKSLQIDGSCVIEDTVQNGVKNTKMAYMKTDWSVNDTIENGVKKTSHNPTMFQSIYVEDAIQNGIKETHDDAHNHKDRIDGVIKNGVRDTQSNPYENESWINGVIKNGVKHTEYGDWLDGDERLDDIVKNGVKETLCGSYLNVDNVIQDGVKHTFDTEYMPKTMVEDIIQNGVKETKTPGKDGDILSTIEWMEENKSNSYTKMINDVIDNGELVSGTYAGGQRQSEKCKSVVEYGTKNKNP